MGQLKQPHFLQTPPTRALMQEPGSESTVAFGESAFSGGFVLFVALW